MGDDKLLLLGEFQNEVNRLQRILIDKYNFDCQAIINFREVVPIIKIKKFKYIIIGTYMNDIGRVDLKLFPLLKKHQSEATIIMRTHYTSNAGATAAFKSGIIKDYFSANMKNTEKYVNSLLGKQVEAEQLPDFPLDWTIRRLIWEYIHDIYYLVGGNISEMARCLKIPRRSIQRKLHSFAPNHYTKDIPIRFRANREPIKS